MEQIQTLPSFDEVYNQYEGRRPEMVDSLVAAESLEVGNRNELDSKISNFATKCLPMYRRVELADSNAFRVEKRGGFRECTPIMSEVVDSAIPLTMVAMKVFSVVGDEKIDSLQIVLLKGSLPGDSPEDYYRAIQTRETDAEFIGDMRLIETDGGFELAHREINPKFRKQGFGNTMLAATESFVAESAKDSQKEKALFLDCSQLDVIYWLGKNGYRPKSDEDWKKLQNVLDGEENLVMLENYFLFDKNVPEDKRYYEYPDGTKTPAYHNAYRIRFVKNIEPEMGQDVADVRQSVSESAQRFV